MAQHPITISILPTALGVAPSADGVMGIVVQSTTVSTTFVNGTAYLITKVADLDTLGVTVANNPEVHQHVTEYFAEAGLGAKLWVYSLLKTTSFATFIASAAFLNFVRGTALADMANLVRGIGFCAITPLAAQSATDFPSDVTDSIPLLHTALNTLFDEGFQCFGVLDGWNLKSNFTAAGLTTMANKAAPNVAVCITGTSGTGISSVGLLLGRLAKITVGTSVGKVADGPIANATAMYFTNGITTGTATKVEVTTLADFNTLGSKQFVFARTWLARSGYYWNDGATCELVTVALSNIEYNRIANKLASDALNYFIGEIGKNLPVNNDGNLDAGYCGNKAEAFFNAYINPLIVSGDISNASMTISGVNFVSTRQLNFSISILPSPALGSVVGTIQFVTTL
jgi:hypothetical protein